MEEEGRVQALSSAWLDMRAQRLKWRLGESHQLLSLGGSSTGGSGYREVEARTVVDVTCFGIS